MFAGERVNPGLLTNQNHVSVLMTSHSNIAMSSANVPPVGGAVSSKFHWVQQFDLLGGRLELKSDFFLILSFLFLSFFPGCITAVS